MSRDRRLVSRIKLPEEAKMKQSNKAPVFLTAEKVEMVHEPDEGDGCIPVDISKQQVFKDEFPLRKKSGAGGGTETKVLV